MYFTFDNHPFVYSLLSNILLYSFSFVLLYFLINQRDNFFEKYKWILFSFIILLILLLRLPSISYNTSFNPDESWLITGAMTLTQNPIFWQSVDGDTSGPLNFYVISIFNYVFNQPFDFISARILAFLLFSFSLFFTFKTLLYFFNTKIAFFALTPIAFYWGSVKEYDFLFYSSEYLSILFVCLIICLISRSFKQNCEDKSVIFFIGFLSIIAVFAKLQVIPITFSLCLSTFIFIITSKHFSTKTKLINSLNLILGSIFGILFIFSILSLIGVSNLAFENYFLDNLSYNQTGKTFFDFNNLFFSLQDNRAELTLFCLSLLILVTILGILKNEKNTIIRGILIVLLATFSIFSVYKTGYLLHHYLLFLLIPCIFLIAELLDKVSKINIQLFYVFAIFLIGFATLRSTFYPSSNQFITTENTTRPLFQSEIAKEIIKNTNPYESIAVFGGASHLYLESQRIQGTRYAHTLWGFYEEEIRNKKFKKYIDDLEKNKVKIFIDSHTIDAPVLNRKNGGYETVPIIKNYIDSKYELINEINQMRIFLRKK